VGSLFVFGGFFRGGRAISLSLVVGGVGGFGWRDPLEIGFVLGLIGFELGLFWLWGVAERLELALYWVCLGLFFLIIAVFGLKNA